MEKKFLILSLKWTHRNSNWFTFWRTNSNGYCWFKDWCGLYEKEEDDSHTKYIDSTLVENDWIKIEYEGKEHLVLPNTSAIRKKLGITKDDLISPRKD